MTDRELDIRPPLRVWKLALLFLATAGLYQLVWLYQFADDIRKSRDASIAPWHWAAAPLLGPLMAIPAYYLAAHLKRWQIERGAEVGHLAEPVLVAVLVVIAYLPFYLLILEPGIAAIIVVWTVLLLCLPWLALQGQMNLVLRHGERPARFGGFARHQVAGIAIGLFFAVPLYAFAFTEFWERRGSAELVAGEIIEPASGFYRIRVGDADWTRVGTGVLTADADFEFFGPDEFTWAIVYDSTGVDVDDVLAYRVQSIKEEYRGADCRQLKSLSAQSLSVVGMVECTGRNLVYGSYIYVARVLRDTTRAVEIVAYTAQSDPERFDEYARRIRLFADGLELVQ